jgi:hypothetical protein
MSGQTRAQLCELWMRLGGIEDRVGPQVLGDLVLARSELYRILCEAE